MKVRQWLKELLFGWIPDWQEQRQLKKQRKVARANELYEVASYQAYIEATKEPTDDN